MVPEEKVRKLENIIRYNFVSKRFIHQALTAAGAENENHDGNRKLSQIGASLVDTILALIVYGTNASRGEGFFQYLRRAGECWWLIMPPKNVLHV